MDLANAPPQLNPALDPVALAAAFARDGRLHVPDLFTDASARRIQTCLTQETAYDLCCNIDDKPRGLANLTAQQRQALMQMAWSQVGLNGFRFVYDQHPISREGEPYRDPGHYWATVLDFLNGPEFLGLARRITGLEAIAFADAQATLYRGGHFLTNHSDEVPGTGRLAAYVLSFTSTWRPEWGGLLEFIGADHHVTAGYLPDFNSLRLFRVPMDHHVSMVTPFAGAGRYAITGWLRAR